MAREFSLGGGQLGASAAALAGGESRPRAGYVTLVLNNTGGGTQTVLLTFQVSGGTARRLARLELEENQQAVVRNVPLAADDVLLGQAETASVVDYLAFASPGGALAVEVYDAGGVGKGVTALRKILAGVMYLAEEELPDLGG